MNDNIHVEAVDMSKNEPVKPAFTEESSEGNSPHPNSTEDASSSTVKTHVAIAPWRLFTCFTLRERITVIFALTVAIIVITIWGISVDVTPTEYLSGYITIFFLLWLSAIDIKSFLLPNKVILAWLICRVVLLMVGMFVDNSPDVLVSSTAGAAIIGLLFLITHYLSRRSLGGGDVKLSFVLGLSLTLSMIFTAVFYGLVVCALFSIVGLALKKLGRKDMIPLGPFLFAGTIIAYLFHIF